MLGDSGQDLSGQVLDLLADRYYEAIDRQRPQDASVDALIAKLDDPYTDYLSPEELQALRDRTDRAYYGVGLQVAQRDEDVVVVRVYEDSPADREGVKAGDRIVSVEGEDAQGRRSRRGLRDPGRGGHRGHDRRPDGGRAPTGAHHDARPHPGAGRGLEDRHRDGRKIGYLALAQFSRGATDALRDTVTSLRERGAQALVLDLRGDPGGLLDEAVGISGAFLPEGSTVVVTEGLHSHRRVFPTDAGPVAGDLPLYVLVNRNSASASEIVAGALRDAKRGRLVGERTFGKALVQSTILLRNGGALKLTTQRYLTPSGYDLAKRGLPPAVRIVDDPATPPDEALQKALALAAAPGEPGRAGDVLVAEMISSGRGAAAQPAFEPGPACPLAKGARGGRGVGDLVTVGMRGRAGRVVAVHGPSSSPRAAMRALLASEDMGRPFPRAAVEEADALDESGVADDPGGGTCATSASSPSTRRGRRTTTTPWPSPPRAAARGACGSTSPTSRGSSPRAAPSTARRRDAARPCTCRGRSTRCSPRACRPTCAACAPVSTGRRSRSRWWSTATATSARRASRGR